MSFIDKLEPEIIKLDAEDHPFGLGNSELSQAFALMSIAISMKRIADGIDHICNYGIITAGEP
jgi:hypothetical protein